VAFDTIWGACTIKAQYVQTSHPYDVISYDFRMGSLETGGLGL
jgi:hypothetical protein